MDLVIKQHIDRTETVSSSLIDMLYYLTKPDSSTGQSLADAVLVGRIQSTAAYEDAVNFLNDKFSSEQDNGSDFQVTVLNNNYYIRFADPEVVSVLTDKGVIEGEGITAAQATQVKWTDGWFRNNSLISSFDEIRYFTGLLQQGAQGYPRTERTFQGSSVLESVDITDIVAISYYEFAECPNLIRFHGKDGPVGVLNLESLQRYPSDPGMTTATAYSAFYNCPGIQHITSLGSIPYIKHSMFSTCLNLEDVNLPLTCTGINDNAFNGDSKLTTINLSHVTYIGGGVFQNCSLLEYCDGPNSTQGELNLPDLTGTLGRYAFKGCVKITSVASLGSITAIGSNVFEGCTKLETVNLPLSCINLNGNCFISDLKLHTINLSHVTAIDSQAFEGCSSLEYCGGPNSTQGELNLPYLTTLGYRAFYGCVKLTSAPNLGHITEIQYRTFENCTGLLNINFPNSVSRIGDNAFEGTAWYNAQPNGAVIINNVLYKVKNSVGSTYTIPDGITFITKEAFKGISDLTEVTFPNNMMVTEGMGMDSAFDGCTALTTVNNLHTTLIPQYFCCNCSNLTTITIPSTVTTIKENAFSGCNLSSISIPASVMSISSTSFRNNPNCASIAVDANNTVYDSRNNCNAIIISSSNILFIGCKNTIIPNTVTEIGEYAFYYCKGLSSISIPNGVTKIGNGAFAGCESMTGNLTVPGSVKKIGNSAFGGCANAIGNPGLNNITFQEGVEEIGYYFFDRSRINGQIQIASTVTKIDYNFLIRVSPASGNPKPTVKFMGSTPPTFVKWTYFNNVSTVYVPQGSLAAYQAAYNNGYNGADMQPDSWVEY